MTDRPSGFESGAAPSGAAKLGENCLRVDGRLSLVPISIRDATAFVARTHRHHDPPRGAIFAVAVADESGTIRGVAMVGRPVARNAADGWTAEVTRVATDGAKNACSMLYGACWRAARAMGYRRIITYTLGEERGDSVRAAGWRVVAETKGGSWSRTSRPRVDHHPTQAKIRWEMSA
jgi:hypothetical protein